MSINNVSSLLRWTDRAAQLGGSIMSNIQSTVSFTKIHFKRRNAVRHKIDCILDHKFEQIILKEFTYCSQCHGFIWGIVGQSCKLCKLVSHEECLSIINCYCVQGKTPVDSSHQFEAHTFLTPTYCNQCGKLLIGLFKQGQKCRDKKDNNGNIIKGCGFNVHDECMKLVCEPCNHILRTPKKDKPIVPTEDFEMSKRISIRDFVPLGLIGTGSSGKVWLAELKLNRQKYAIKVIKKTELVISGDPQSALTEMEVLNFGRGYQFLAHSHCCFRTNERLFFVMEYAEGRDLVYHIEKDRKFSEDRARFYAAEIVLALRYLHTKNVVYRDLKLENVIIDRQGHCKIVDFGSSKRLSNCMKTRTFCGTPNYISPEMIKELDYGFSVDWWALGVLMFEMLLGYTPFEADDIEQLYKEILNKNVYFPKFLTVEARSVLEGFLTKDPVMRLGCNIVEGCEQAILEHPFFMFEDAKGRYKTHRWDDIEKKQVQPPWRPSSQVLDNYETSHMDLTPINSSQLKKIPQAKFQDFSFCSESFESLLESPSE